MSREKTLLVNLDLPIRYIKGVGPKKAELPQKLGLLTVFDLLTYFPRAYQDRTKIMPIAHLSPKSKETVKGVVVSHHRSKKILKVSISDGTGYLSLLFFNRPKMGKFLPKGTNVIVSGYITTFRREFQTSRFDYEVINEEGELIHTSGLIPVYPLSGELTEGSQRQLRLMIRKALDQFREDLIDPLPFWIKEEFGLADLSFAIFGIHFPKSEQDYKRARKRLVFDEFFYFHLAFGLTRKGAEEVKKKFAYGQDGDGLTSSFLSSLPFQLTGAQQRVISEISKDLTSPHPMHRLLHGEVGSGKTVCALYASLLALANDLQVAFMAPTEILAWQHYLNIERLLSGLEIRPLLLTGSLKKKEREQALTLIAGGQAKIVVGTHSLIQEQVKFSCLGLCIIDEQHRFGVMQRADLIKQAASLSGYYPDVLAMTATPIPRSLALTLYGDLDVSCLDELPLGRKPVITKCRSEEALPKIYDFIKAEIARGHQAYIVYPLIEENEELPLKAARKMAEELSEEVFKEEKLSLLHGRMKREEREEIMKEFREGKIKVLVATTVIEVGIDVSKATVMLISDAQRFGLAQLHQLRGRVGRGGDKSYCILLTSSKVKEAVEHPFLSEDEAILKAAKRIRTMTETNDGFKVAQADLEIRGPGEFFGTKQSGMPEFKLANIIYDVKPLEFGRQAAASILRADHDLSSKEHEGILETFKFYYQQKLKVKEIG